MKNRRPQHARRKASPGACTRHSRSNPQPGRPRNIGGGLPPEKSAFEWPVVGLPSVLLLDRHNAFSARTMGGRRSDPTSDVS